MNDQQEWLLSRPDAEELDIEPDGSLVVLLFGKILRLTVDGNIDNVGLQVTRDGKLHHAWLL